MTWHRRVTALAGGLTLAAVASTAIAQDDSAGVRSELEPQECVTEALRSLGADCYRFTGEEN